MGVILVYSYSVFRRRGGILTPDVHDSAGLLAFCPSCSSLSQIAAIRGSRAHLGCVVTYRVSHPGQRVGNALLGGAA